jgi:hypothetical protein
MRTLYDAPNYMLVIGLKHMTRAKDEPSGVCSWTISIMPTTPGTLQLEW